MIKDIQQFFSCVTFVLIIPKVTTFLLFVQFFKFCVLK